MGIRVVDVFAGPGGLNEGFASFSTDAGEHPFSIVKSIEMDPVACRTLRLRSAVRQLTREARVLPEAYVKALRDGTVETSLPHDTDFALALAAADEHVWQFTLDSETRDESDRVIRSALQGDDSWILVGGPPCQLYSLVGRARASKLEGFEDDVRHVLYKEYLHIIRTHKPAVFVMENVKGMLSAKHREGQIFDLIQQDIHALDYALYSFVSDADTLTPSDFVIRSEKYGVPQRRHRVILLGIRRDMVPSSFPRLKESPHVTVGQAIGSLAEIRSRLSPVSMDSRGAWVDSRAVGLAHAGAEMSNASPATWGSHFVHAPAGRQGTSECLSFITHHTPELEGFAQHESRSHMRGDIERYAFYAAKARGGVQVKVTELPKALQPAHRNVGGDSTPFTDRFRVQHAMGPSTTVVSHISKDGHYFIHPDPMQARSLTVREAARLQSFPDDYYFCGSRTQQFHQVGNAVPPFLARQLAEVVHEIINGGTDTP